MGIAFDPEDIFGVAVVDLGRRVLMFMGCHLMASFLACLALGMGEAICDLEPGEIFGWIPYVWFLFLAPYLSIWGILYLPVVIACAFRFYTCQGTLFRSFLIFLGIEGLLIVFSASEFSWEAVVSVVMFVGCWGGLAWLGLLLEQRWRRKAEEHFMGLAVENEMRREGLIDDFGTASFDGVDDGS